MSNTNLYQKEIYPIDQWDEFMVAEHLDITKNHLVGHYNSLWFQAKKSGDEKLAEQYSEKRSEYVHVRMQAASWTEDERRSLVKKWWLEVNLLPKPHKLIL